MNDKIVNKFAFFSLSLLVLTQCSTFRNDVGLTANTYSGFTKDEAVQYNYVFDVNKISYKDKDGKSVVLTQEEKQKVVDNVNQCLIDAGYGYNGSKTKTMVLNLDFTENEEKNKELYYDLELAERYKSYDYNIEKNIGPNNRLVSVYYFVSKPKATFVFGRKTRDKDNSIYAETLFNYLNKDKVYYVSTPYYSKFAGLQVDYGKLSTECSEKGTQSHRNTIRFFVCKFGKTDISNFYAKLSGKDNNMTKFDVKLQYMMNLIKNDGDLEKNRTEVVDYLYKNICIFIADNANDLGISIIKSGTDYSGQNGVKFKEYQDIKNLMNNADGNYYVVKNRITGENFDQLNEENEYKMVASLYDGDKIDSIWAGDKRPRLLRTSFWASTGNLPTSGVSRIRSVDFYNMKYSLNNLEIVNNLVFDKED